MDHNRYKALLAEAGAHFTHDTDGHEMTVLHDDGLYRHIRFARRGSLTYFDLITWPGSLTIEGSHGTWTFRRDVDMFEFFRRSNGVNVDYWAEKLPDGRDSAKRYSEDATLRLLVETYTEHGRYYTEKAERYEADLSVWNATDWRARYPMAVRGPREPVKPPTVAELRQQVADWRRDGLLSDEGYARRLLEDWESKNVVSDTCEWDLREYDYHLAWSCHAIAWGVRQYAAAKVVTVDVPVLAGTR